MTRQQPIWAGAGALLVTFVVAGPARALSSYPPRLPSQQVCTTCHAETQTYTRNPFGLDFAALGHTWNGALASLDSDGDGYTNGQELLDPEGDGTTVGFGSTPPGTPNDMNECNAELDDCVAQATCSDFTYAPPEGPTSFSCSCFAGYAGDGRASGTGCSDVDECSDPDACLPNSQCVNQVGGYDCPCDPGYFGNGLTGCTQDDACDPPPCSALVSCTSVPPDVDPAGFACGACPPGFAGDGVGDDGCLDVNDCAVDNGGCDPLTACLDGYGHHTCGTCPPGYTGDGVIGCTLAAGGCATEPCSPFATCTDLDGDYLCECLVGYEGDGFDCVDIDECADDPCGADELCVDLEGAYACPCAPGYERVGGECVVETRSEAAIPDSSDDSASAGVDDVAADPSDDEAVDSPVGEAPAAGSTHAAGCAATGTGPLHPHGWIAVSALILGARRVRRRAAVSGVERSPS